ncbi:MAG: choice-of-anchor V domain-containing protein [Chitinophagales bacterium]
MKKTLTLIVAAIILFAINGADLTSGPLKPPLGYTAAPDEGDCTSCHYDTPLNGGTGNISLAFSGSSGVYLPGKTYTVTVTVTDVEQSPICCFEVTTLNSNNLCVGTYKLLAPDNTLIRKNPQNGRTYVTNYQTPLAYHQWSYKWKAPPISTGPITIYATGNAGNNNQSPIGDHIYSTTLTVVPGNEFNKMNEGEETSFSIYPSLIQQQFTAHYSLSESGTVAISLYGLQGQLLQTFLNEEQEAGVYQQSMSLSHHFAPGIYLLSMQQGERKERVKVMIQ